MEEGYSILREGDAEILMRGNDVFYNKAQVKNRPRLPPHISLFLVLLYVSCFLLLPADWPSQFFLFFFLFFIHLDSPFSILDSPFSILDSLLLF